MTAVENAIQFGKLFLQEQDDSSGTYSLIDKNGKEVERTSEGDKITKIDVIGNVDLVILYTDTAVQYYNADGEQIDGSDGWEDHYYDPFNHQFYRKDHCEHWFAIDGTMVLSPILQNRGVLTNLLTKTSIKNEVFRDLTPVTSVNSEIIQIGKLILDKNLKPINYHGQKITGIEDQIMFFENGDIYQEVRLDIKNFGFIHESKHTALTVEGDLINKFISSRKVNNKTYLLVEGSRGQYLLDQETAKPISLHNKPHNILMDTYRKVGQREFICIQTATQHFYCDIQNQCTMQIESLGNEKIIALSPSYVNIDGEELYNLKTKSSQCVLSSKDLTIYNPETISFDVEKIVNIPGFEDSFAQLIHQSKKYLFSLYSKEIVEFEYGRHIIASIDGTLQNKLVNASTTLGKKVVLDFRRGTEYLSLAKSNDRLILQMEGLPKKIGSKVLQNAIVQSLGGEQSSVINLNAEQLDPFTLPSGMTDIADGTKKSVFAGIEIESIDFLTMVKVSRKQFYSAQFRSYDDELRTILLHRKNGHPFLLEGLGHKNELVTGFVDYTLKDKFHLGPHRMIGAYTLKEDLKENELLFSLNEMTSWLPFYDSYLPIFKKVLKSIGSAPWQYHLFELREISSEKEYIAIENRKPHRILIKNSDKKIPLVVSSKNKILKSPEEISMIRNLFVKDPGILVEVY